MSKFEDYNRTCHNYDSVRVAVGYDVIAGMLPFYCGKPLKDLHLLDAGCGTGNYTKALLNVGLGHVSLLDGSSGMLEKAREKLVDEIAAGKVVEITEAKMPSLPYPDDSFDAVLFCMVLHHLQDKPDGENFPAIEKVISEAKRVLKKDGVICICTNFPQDYLPLVWFTKLNENIMKKHSKQFPQFKHWMQILDKSGFKLLSKLDNNMPASPKMIEGFLDPLGPTRKEWRDVNSYWASGTPEEIKDVENKVLEMHKKGTLKDYAKENTHIDGLFYFTFIFAKPV